MVFNQSVRGPPIGLWRLGLRRSTFAFVSATATFFGLIFGVAIARAEPAPRPALRTCVTCHDAPSDERTAGPRLEGLSRSYLTRQIQSFLRHERGASVEGHSCSTEALTALKPVDFIEVVNLYSGRAPAPLPVPAAAEAEIVEGARLYREGRLQAGVQPCAACHGWDGTGGVQRGLESASVAPRLAGQRERYLYAQLRSFRRGLRNNDFNGIMRRMVADLSDPDYRALAAYLSRLDPASVPPQPEAATGVAMPEKAALCQACHGLGGESMSETFPKIAGLSKDHIVKQLRDIQAGRRAVDVMAPIVYTLTDAEMEAIGGYFAAFEMRKGPFDAMKAQRGEQLFHNGNVTTGGYPACMYCHGVDGAGISGIDWAPGDIPRLAGQHPGYLRKALYDFRDGRRTNDHASLMRLVALRMTDREIDDVSHYLYSLGEKPAPP